jgi:maleamate amidohydrolase
VKWLDILSENDRNILNRGRFGRRMGFGIRPGVLCIDCQVYMTGDKDEPLEESIKRFPASCGHLGWEACHQIARLLKVAREVKIPIFYTQVGWAPDERDPGVLGMKMGTGFLNNPNYLIENTPGWEISPLLKPQPGDVVIRKKKNSAFFGTPLVSYLVDRQVDTLLITGGSTANCVRATVFDAAAYNYRPIVVEECVFDRLEISHKVNLFDMDRQYADVVGIEEVLAHLGNMKGRK